MSSTSPILSSINSHSPATPSVASSLKTSTACSIRGHVLADCLDQPGADVRPGQAEDRGQQLEDAREVERVGQLDAGLGERAEEPAHQALAQVGDDVVLEPHDAALDALDEVAEEARPGCLMISPITSGGLREDVAQHGLQLEDRVDDGLDRADRLVDEALVLGLQLLDAVVEALARLDVLARERVDERRPACRRRRTRAARTCSSISFDASVPTFCRSRGQALDVRGDLGLARGDPRLAAVRSMPTMSATLAMTRSISLR